jgi:hydroxymethylpyrimidine kinase/phosphomethylpyrimidine kinase
MAINIAIIGGTDSSGGAGLGADQKTILDHNCSPHSVITAITFQNSPQVRIYTLPRLGLKGQLDSLSEYTLDAIKIGMLPDESSVLDVLEFIKKFPDSKVILDPVRFSSSGFELMTTKAWTALKDRLLPQLDLITPNMEEARLLVGAGINERIPTLDLAKKCLDLGAHAVLLKGGHDDDPKTCTDILAQKKEGPELFKYPRIHGGTEVRGTGCRLASAIACQWAKIGELLPAVQGAGQYLQNYIKKSLS